MAPKKKGGSKKEADPAKLVDSENLKRAEAEIVSLQRQLELRSHETLEARRSERIWREKCSAFGEALEKQKEDTLDITSDMMRKYKVGFWSCGRPVGPLSLCAPQAVLEHAMLQPSTSRGFLILGNAAKQPMNVQDSRPWQD